MNINFGLYDGLYILAGFVFASFVFSIYVLKLKKDIKTVKRWYEKKSIGADDSSLRVKTLENKVKTLEAALKKQMENK